MTDAELLAVRESVLRLQMRLHHSHSIHNDIERCDYKSCVEERTNVSCILKLLSAPDPAIWVTRAEMRRVVAAALEPYSVCSRIGDPEPKPCNMDCGFGNLQGCEAVKAYLKDQLAGLDEFLEDMR